MKAKRYMGAASRWCFCVRLVGSECIRHGAGADVLTARDVFDGRDAAALRSRLIATTHTVAVYSNTQGEYMFRLVRYDPGSYSVSSSARFPHVKKERSGHAGQGPKWPSLTGRRSLTRMHRVRNHSGAAGTIIRRCCSPMQHAKRCNGR